MKVASKPFVMQWFDVPAGPDVPAGGALRDLVMKYWLGLVMSVASVVAAAPPPGVPSADTRFQDRETRVVPDFQRHVVPLLGRLGCNSAKCHGSFQGQADFRLSLFGFDFAADHCFDGY